jgi:aminoglycoside/choline kinase family phosphotransferase
MDAGNGRGLDSTLGAGSAEVDHTEGRVVGETLQPITTEMLETVLRRAGAIGADSRIVSARSTPSAMMSLFGGVSRVHLEYERSDASGPASVIVKSSSTTGTDIRGLGRTEARFYLDRMPERSSIHAPPVYSCELDEQTGHTRLILGDMGEDGFVRQIDGCTRDQAMSAMHEIARMHAAWWGRPLPDSMQWVYPPPISWIGRFCYRQLRAYSGEWPEALGDLPTRLISRYAEIGYNRLAAAPRTVVHGDFHSHNMVFSGNGDVTLLDFQCVQHAAGPLDVARFLATSLQVEMRRAIELDVLREYHARLQSLGVESYSFDRCIGAFRAGLLWNLVTPLAIHLRAMAIQHAPWPARLPILERCLTAIEDWNAAELL